MDHWPSNESYERTWYRYLYAKNAHKFWRMLHTIYTHDLKWIIELNMIPKTVKPLEENVGENLWDLEVGEEFLVTKNAIHKNI